MLVVGEGSLLFYQMPSIPQRDKAGLRGAVRHVRTEVFQFADDGGIPHETSWYHSTVSYNEDGYAMEQVTHSPNGVVTRTTYWYDENGRLAETRNELDGASTGRTVYLYDSEGRLS